MRAGHTEKTQISRAATIAVCTDTTIAFAHARSLQWAKETSAKRVDTGGAGLRRPFLWGWPFLQGRKASDAGWSHEWHERHQKFASVAFIWCSA